MRVGVIDADSGSWTKPLLLSTRNGIRHGNTTLTALTLSCSRKRSRLPPLRRLLSPCMTPLLRDGRRVTDGQQEEGYAGKDNATESDEGKSKRPGSCQLVSARSQSSASRHSPSGSPETARVCRSWP